MFRTHSIALMIVLGAAASGGEFGRPAEAATAYRTPRYANFETYGAGRHRLRFIAKMVSGIEFTKGSLNREANRIQEEAQTSGKKTHVWDDNWYQMKVPMNGSSYLLIIVHDLTNGKHSWVAVKNSPGPWTVMDNHGNVHHPSNGRQIKFARTYNNTPVSLWIRNPDNADQGYVDHGLLNSGEHIYYGFGY